MHDVPMLSIRVQAYTGDRLLCGSADMFPLIEAAERRGLPLLSGVDVYDDTTFNQKQSVQLQRELDELAGQSEGLDLLITSVRQALAIVDAYPHIYLIFDGD